MSRVRVIAGIILAPSWTMLVIALTMVGGSFIGLLLLTPETLRPFVEQYVGFDRAGEAYRIFEKLARFEEHADAGDALTVVIVGGSTVRETIWSEAELSEKISAQSNRPVSVFNFATSGQKLIVSWELAERAACGGADIVVFGVNLGRISQQEALESYFPLLRGPRPANVLEYFRAQSATSGRTLWPPSDNLKFNTIVLNRIGERLDVSEMLYLLYARPAQKKANDKSLEPRHRYLAKSPLAEKAFAKRLGAAEKKHTGASQEIWNRNFDIVQRAVAGARACGSKVLLVDSPLNPLLTADSRHSDYARANELFLTRVKNLSLRSEVPFIDLNSEARFSESDFFDFGHLRTESAMRASTAIIAGEIAQAAGGQAP